jgi:hypothetical protein
LIRIVQKDSEWTRVGRCRGPFDGDGVVGIPGWEREGYERCRKETDKNDMKMKMKMKMKMFRMRVGRI